MTQDANRPPDQPSSFGDMILYLSAILLIVFALIKIIMR